MPVSRYGAFLICGLMFAVVLPSTRSFQKATKPKIEIRPTLIVVKQQSDS
jgi:hypothetical protein